MDESSDTWDSIEWLVKHVANHNGKVGMWGISYPGYYAAMGMIDAHPALKAVSPQAPISDWFVGDDWHHNGALMLSQAFNFMAVFGRPRPQPIEKLTFTFDHETPDGYQFFLEMGPLANANARYFKGDVSFWNEVMRHGTYDEFWKAAKHSPAVEGHSARRDDGGRLVRRGRPLRRWRHIATSKRVATAAAIRWSWGRGCMAGGGVATGNPWDRSLSTPRRRSSFAR